MRFCNKISLIVVLLFIYLSNSFAQKGTPYISHFEEIKEIETHNWSICQNEQNVMLFANRRGIISFDGQNWNLIKLLFIPFTLKKNPADNKVYVGANNNYGYLEIDQKGFLKYTSLCKDSSDIGIISKIIFNGSDIFFYGDQTITRYNINNQTFKRWESEINKPFTGMFTTNKNTFFNVFGKGLYRLESDTLFPIVTGYYTENNEILFSLPYNETRVLVGTDNSELYTFDGIKYYKYEINDEGYLKESVLADAQIISDSLYAFGTLYGGVEIVNKKTGKIVYTVNYQNGLPDDEIYSLGLDNNNGLWLSHEFGVSRVDFNLPVRNYGNYPGLKGNLLSTLWFKDQLYVATNEGVFYLSEVKDFNEVEVWVKTKARSSSSSSSKATNNQQVQEREVKKTTRRLFSKWFSKDEPEKEKNIQENKEKVSSSTPKPKTRYIKKTVSQLKSIKYIYKKIEGLNDKCTQLIPTESGILVASNNGIYSIDQLKATQIVKGKYINQIIKNSSLNSYFVATNSGILSLKNEKNKWIAAYDYVDFTEPIYSISFQKKDHLWLGGDNSAYRFQIDSLGLPIDMKKYSIQTDFPEQFKMDYVNDTPIVFLESGLYYYNTTVDSFMVYDKNEINSLAKVHFFTNQTGIPWIKTDGIWTCINSSKIWTPQEESYLKLFDNITSIISDKEKNLWIINNNNQIYKITHRKFSYQYPDFYIFFNKITNEEGLHFELSDLNFDPTNKAIYVHIIAPYYIKHNSTQYQYFVEGLMNDWSNWSPDQTIDLIIKPGKYSLHVRAKNIWGNKSLIKSIKFNIAPPFTESIWFYLIVILSIIILFYFILRVRERKLMYDKKILEIKVKERTIEIQEKSEEIETQRDEITFQRDEILRQKEEITDSINYASRIQNAAMPLKDHFEKAFADHFILLKPRDIVSGDFYWTAEDDDKLYFTAADCTGHGVPGAFMSMLGISSLNEMLSHEKRNLTASKILNLLREKIKFSLNQIGKDGENKDGMDMAFCIYHKKKKIIEYAGAYNSLYLIRKGELVVYKADRMPIGIYHIEKESFTNHEIKVQKDDVIYIFSDGYADQFGGPGQTKFKSAGLKKLLIEIHLKTMSEQKEILNDRFNKWKGKLDQVDDVLFIGIRL